MQFGYERNCVKRPLELIGLRFNLVVAFCIIILTVYSTGYYDKCFKNGNTKSLSETQFMMHRTE